MDALRRFICGNLFENPRNDSNLPISEDSTGSSSQGTNSRRLETQEPQTEGPLDSQASHGIVQPTEHSVDEYTRKNADQHLEALIDSFAKPQLSAHDLEMFLYPDEGEIRWGDTGTAMTLTEGFVCEVNTILRYENKITRYTKDLNHVEKQIREATELVSRLEQQISELADDEHEERASKNNLLNYGMTLYTELNNKRGTLAEKLDKATHEVDRPKKDMFRSLKRVFQKYNLLKDISGNSDSGHVEASNVPKQEEPVAPRAPPTPTASEAARAAEEEARYAAYDRKEQLEGRVYELHQRLDNWYQEYDDTLRNYKEAFTRGDTDDTKTIFDNHMFYIQQEIVQDLVLSERELQEAIDDARGIGIIFGGSEQESHFQDYADDGYRISHEQEWIQDLDRSKIEKWVQGLPDDEPPSPLEALKGYADEWDVRSVDFGESISVIAEGKPRVRIDRWRSTLKHEHFARFDRDVDIEVEHHLHSYQKRRCRRTNTL